MLGSDNQLELSSGLQGVGSLLARAYFNGIECSSNTSLPCGPYTHIKEVVSTGSSRAMSTACDQWTRQDHVIMNVSAVGRSRGDALVYQR